MTSLDFVIAGGILLLLGICLLLVRQIGALKATMTNGDNQQQLIRIETRITEMAHQASQREAGIRDELRVNREETGKSVAHLGETVRKLGADQSQQQQQFRDKLDEKMKELRQENTQKLEEMRKTVDEKLQTTLERRLTESFKTVSERLEAVQRGLGEMQNLAIGVGDLKRVLTNVKSRGTFGEVQLARLIEDFLTPDQFIANYDCGLKSGTKRVEFGISMPGPEKRYLPVDSKFPTESYERLLEAVEVGDKPAVDAASAELIKTIRVFAKDISQKYINPPYTTNDAILFVPTEGLYAEILRSPGLIENLQRDFSVTVAGPTIFQVVLNTFRMGYQQAVMQDHAAEVWKVLGAVKREFNSYGEQIAAMGKNVQAMEKHIDKFETRKKMMLKALDNVDEVEDGTAQTLLGTEPSESVPSGEATLL